jgi:Predicted signal transduction protein with a C-terminal ATPase domain
MLFIKRLGFLKIKVSNKIILASILSVLIISTLSTGISFFISSNILEQKIIEIYSNTLKQDVNHIENKLSQTEMYITTFLDDERFNSMLTVYASSKQQTYSMAKEIENYLHELCGSYMEIQFFYLVTPDNKLITNDQYARPGLDYAYFSSKISKNSDLSWSYINSGLTSFGDCILLTKKISDFKTSKDIGIISITFNRNNMTNFYRYVNRNKCSFSMLTPEMKPIFSTQSMPKNTLNVLGKNLSDSNEGYLIKNNNIYLYNKSLYTGWIGVITLDYNTLASPIRVALKKYIPVFLICIFLSLVASVLYAAKFKASISIIKKAIEKVVSNNLNVEIDVKHVLRANTKNSLLILFCFTIFIPILISITFAYNMFTGSLKDELFDYFYVTIDTLKVEITSDIESYEQSAHYMTFNNAILAALNGNINTMQNGSIDQLIIKQQKIRGGAFYINILNTNKQYVYSTIPMKNDSLDEFFKSMNVSMEPKVVFDTRKDYYNRYTVSLGKRIFDVNNPDKTLGYLFLNMYERDICDLYSKYLSGDSINTFIINNKGTIISDNKKELIGNSIENAFPNIQWPIKYDRSGSFIREINSEEYLITYTPLENLDWILVNSVLISDFLRNRMIYVNIYIILATLIIIILISFSLAKNISEPLHQLNSYINKVSQGQFNESIKMVSGNDIEELSLNFNKMVFQLRTLIREVYESKIDNQRLELERKEADFLAFQSQIHPHFLYNTLEIIHCKALFITGGENEVSFLITKLADFLRFVTGKNKKLIRLYDEIEYSRNYMSIIQNCGTDIEVRWDIDNNLLNCKIPSLILQPILENAVNHGFQREPSMHNLVVVSLLERAGCILIRIADNGTGINAKKLSDLRNGLLDKASENHIGLKNVHQRIVLSFGKDYGIHIRSKINKGTVVCIKIPKEFLLN